jgi:hypothetical protein
MLSTVPAANASDCRYETNEVDLFTQERLVSTRADEFTEWMDDDVIEPRAWVSAVREGEQDFLAISLEIVELIGYEPTDAELRDYMFIAEGAKLLILLEDETVVELHSHKGVRASSRPAVKYERKYVSGPFKIRYKINSNAAIRYPLDADTSAALAGQSATHVRLSTDNNDFDIRVHERPFGNIKRAVGCLQPGQLPPPE